LTARGDVIIELKLYVIVTVGNESTRTQQDAGLEVESLIRGLGRDFRVLGKHQKYP
jgi:hypothetical protein